MRKLFFILFVLFSVGMSGQTIVRNKVLKTTDLGNQKLEASISGTDTTYVIIIHNGGAAKHPFPVVLGGKDEAIRLMQFIIDADLKAGDVVSLENQSNNMIKKTKMGGLIVFSEGQAFNGGIRKGVLKAFIKTIHEFCGDNPSNTDEDDDDDD